MGKDDTNHVPVVWSCVNCEKEKLKKSSNPRDHVRKGG